MPVSQSHPVIDDAYLAAEARARMNIDRQLTAAGCAVQSGDRVNVMAGPGVAVREFVLDKPHGWVDYLLFLNGQPAGVIEAKAEGTTLVGVDHQSGKYVERLPEWMRSLVCPLSFIYESTGVETHFANGYDPDARSRRVFTFFRPGTLGGDPRVIEAPYFWRSDPWPARVESIEVDRFNERVVSEVALRLGGGLEVFDRLVSEERERIGEVR